MEKKGLFTPASLLIALLLNVCMLVAPAISIAQPLTFQKAFGGNLNDQGVALMERENGDLLVFGNSESYSGPNTTSLLGIQLNGQGVVQLTQSLATGNSDFAGGIMPGRQGGYVISGYTDNFGPALVNGLISSLDSNGNVIWARGAGIAQLEEYTSIDTTPAGDYICVGFTFENGIDIFASKFDDVGNIVWSRTVGSVQNAELSFKGIATSDGGALLLGASDQGAGSDDGTVVKLDNNGGLSFARNYGSVGADLFVDAVETVDGYILLGRTGLFGNTDFFLMKTDTAGLELWTKVYGGSGSDAALDLLLQDDGALIVTGSSSSFGFGMSDGFLMKADSTGNVLWFRSYGGTAADALSYVVDTRDGGFAMTGRTQSFGGADDDFYVIKTDGDGFSGCNEASFSPTVTDTALILFNPTNFVSTAAGITNNKSLISGAPVVGMDSLCASSVCAHTASFSLSNGPYCPGASFTMTNTTSGAIASNWSINGTNVGNSAAVTTVLPSQGPVTLRLVSDAGGGCRDTLDSTIVLEALPQIIYSHNFLCIGDTLQLLNATFGASSSVWIIDGDTLRSDLDTVWVPSSTGTFSIELYSDGLICPALDSIVVKPLPVVGFTYIIGVNGSVSFTNTSPGGANVYGWEFGDGNVTTIEDPTHIFDSTGTYLVCLTVFSPNGCRDSVCQEVSVVVVGREEAMQNTVSIWPNPAGDQIAISGLGGLQAEAMLGIYDLKGRELKSIRLSFNGGNLLDISDLKEGIYFLRIRMEGQGSGFNSKAQKLVVLRNK